MKVKIRRLLLNHKHIITVAFSFIIYITLCLNSVVSVYHPVSWILFLLLIFSYSKIKLYNKDFFKSSIIYSIIFSSLLTLGMVTYINTRNPIDSIGELLLTPLNFFTLIGLMIMIYSIMIYILPKLHEYKNKNHSTKISAKKVFIISFLVILLSWIPYFLALYPGVLTSDSVSELNMIVNNFSRMSNHHPMIHVLFIAVPYKIGYALFHNANLAVACSSITQMITMACIFSYLITFLYQKKVNMKIIILCMVYFAFIPTHASYSVIMWKDTVFSGLVVLLTIQLIKICDISEDLKFKDLISFILISLLVILFRNNGIYMYFILMIMMLLILRKKIKILLPAFFIVFLSYFSITGPMFAYFDIEKSSSSEYIAIPLQQVARMAYKDVEFTNKEKILLNRLMGVNNMKIGYIPQCSDGIKYNINYNREYFDKHKIQYFILWIKLVFKHPDIALESYAVSTLGYWYPGVPNWSTSRGVVDNKIGISRNSKAPEFIENFVQNSEGRNIPIINMSANTALAFWILSIFCYICIKKGKRKYLIAYIPVFGIWFTMMIASPVNSEFRYVYSSYTCLPLLMLLPYMNKKNINAK